MTILLAITFILGPFDFILMILDKIIKTEEDVITMFIRTTPLLNVMGKFVFYISMIFQAYHWLFQCAVVY